MATENPYLAQIQSELDERDQRFKATASMSLDSDPDKVARQRRVAGYLGRPLAAVEALPEESRRDAALLEMTSNTATSPVLRQRYGDKDFADLAHDDSFALSKVEKVLRSFVDGGPSRVQQAAPASVMNSAEFSNEVRRQMAANPALDWDTARRLAASGTMVDNINPLVGPATGPAPTLGNIARGIFSTARFESVSRGLSLFTSDVLGLDPAPAIQRYDLAKSRADALDPEFETTTAKGIYGGFTSLIQNSPGVALSLLTGTPLPGLLMAGGMVGGEGYGKYRSRGATPGQAGAAALGEAAVEVSTELLPMRFMVDRLGKAGAGEFLKGLLAREVPGEQIATLAQDAIDTAIANPDKTWAQYAAERPGAFYQTLLATVVQSGAMGAASTVATRISGFDAAAARAERLAVQAEDLNQLISTSRLRERDPQAFNQFVREVTESGEAPAEFFIDSEQLVSTLNQSGVTIEQLETVMPETAAQLQDAVPGADIRVPVAEFTAAGPAVATALVEHLREAPEAMSRAEARQYLTEQGDQIRAAVESELAKQAANAENQGQAAKLQAQFEQQLNDAGKFRPEVNKAYAALLTNFYAAQAARLGMTPQELADKYQLRVTSRDVAGQQRLEQGGSGANVVFEVAPDPNDTALTARWNALDDAERFEVSQKVAAKTVPKVLAALSATGAMTLQLGGYLGATNPSLTLRLDQADKSVPAAKLLGHALAQDSMMVVSETQVEGTDPIGAITIALPAGYSTEQVTALYDRLWQLEENGEKLVGGHTTADGQMVILNFSGLTTKALADRIDEHLAGEFEIDTRQVFSAFIEKSEYGYASDRSDRATASRKPPAKRRSDNLRREAAQLIREALDAREQASSGSASEKVRGSPGPGSTLDQGTRGTLTFANDITTAPSVVALLEGADLSTFLHESGHFFLEAMADMASRIQSQIASGASVTEAERAIVADMDAVLAWFGVKGGLDEWAQMSLDQRRESHEQFARGFEAYVMEGKAPSQELQPLFSRFRAWLVAVYKTLSGLNVQLTDEVRTVMARMLATDEAIAAAQAARDMGPLFQTPEQAGMTPEEYADYQALGARATATAEAELDGRLMKDMKWLSRARNAALKARQAEVDALRQEVEREVRAEVMAEPVYRAWAFLTGKQDQVLPGTTAPENMDPTTMSGRLRTSLVKATNPEQWKTLSERHMTAEDTGLDPDIAAELFGFPSGDALVRALAAAPDPRVQVAELTDWRLMEQHGDIASQEALNQAADEAVHNELRARVIAAELKALARATKVRESGDSLYGRSTVDVMARAAEQFAQQVVARQHIKSLRPAQYGAAEARSAKLAQKALGNTAEAAMHKRNQLVNNYAAKAAYAAQAEVRKGVEFFRRVVNGARDQVSKTRDFDVVQAARAILAEYGVGTKGEAAQKYLEAVAQNDPGMHAVLRDKVDALTAGAKPLNELTVEEFRGLLEEIRGLWYLAKRSKQVEIDGALIDIEAAKLPLVQRMEAIGVPDRVPGEGQAVTDSERRLTRLQGLRAALRRVEAWVGVKDGSEAMGPFRRYIWQPIREAADRYRADKAKYLAQYRALLESVDVGQGRIDAPELGYTFGFSRGGSGKAEILHAVLHTGNASNLRKLLLGGQARSVNRATPWATERADGTLDTTKWDGFVKRMIDTGVLTKADFDFAQGVWDLLEGMKPLAQKAHRDVFGRYFDEVTADEFTNQFGTYRGGYVPAVVDPEVVRDAATRALQEDENQTLAYAFPSTNRGFTKTRVENNKPLLLDLRLITQHMDKVLLFAHMEQPIRDVRKILLSKAVSAPLQRIDPTAYDGLLTPWMNRSARQVTEVVPGGNNNAAARFFSVARSHAGMAAMFANLSNTVQQITGFSLAALKVRPKYLRASAAQWISAPRQTSEAVASASSYMATRMDNEVAQMTGAINDILLNPNLYERAQAWAVKHAYFMQAAVDNVMGPIIWTGAYNEALEAGHSVKDAIRLADSAVRETQGSNLPEDISHFEGGSAITGHPFMRMFTQFAGYFNMQANLLGTEFARNQHELGLRRGMGRGLYIFTFGFLAPAMVAELIAQAFRGGPDDEDKDGDYYDDWLRAVLLMGPVRNALAMVPGVGPAINAGINAWNRKPYDDRISTSPAISMIESLLTAPHSVYKAVAEDGSARKAVKDVATLISMTTGLPAAAIARPVGYLAEVQQNRARPTGPADVARGLATGAVSPESKR